MLLEKKVYVGIVVAPHGIKGDVSIKTFTQEPENVFSYRTLYDQEGKKLAKVNLSRVASTTKVIARFSGCDDRNSAEVLVGTKLYIDRSDLPKLQNDEYYFDDLVGCKVMYNCEGSNSENNGIVLAVHDYGAGTFLDIQLSTTTKIATLPFNKEAVIHVDIVAKTLVIDSTFLVLS